jgi:preflagellin peptidase FlaK
MVEELFVVLAVAGAVVASYTDLESRIIPNRLTLTLVGAGVAGYLALGISSGDFSMFFASMKSLIVMFALGYLFWMMGAWSAGDAKEFLFIAALIPVYPAFLLASFDPAVAGYPFIVTVLANTLLAIFPVIFIYSFYITVQKGMLGRFIEPARDAKKYLETAFVLTAGISLAGVLFGRFFALFTIILLFKLSRNYRLTLSASLIVGYLFLSIGGLYMQVVSLVTNFVVVFLLVAVARLLLNSIGILRNEALVETVKISNIEEGAIIAEEIYIAKGEVIRDRRGTMEKLTEAAKTGAFGDILQRKGAVGMGAAGVTNEEVELLKGFVKEGKLEDDVRIKKSMAFAPVVLVGLVISLLVGDVMLALRMWLYG